MRNSISTIFSMNLAVFLNLPILIIANLTITLIATNEMGEETETFYYAVILKNCENTNRGSNCKRFHS
jgi:hypothetical protein